MLDLARFFGADGSGEGARRRLARGRFRDDLHRLRPTALALLHVRAQIARDRIEPRTQLVGLDERTGGGPSAPEGLLDQVLGLARVAELDDPDREDRALEDLEDGLERDDVPAGEAPREFTQRSRVQFQIARACALAPDGTVGSGGSR